MAISAPKKGSKFNFSSAIEETVSKKHTNPIQTEVNKPEVIEENPEKKKTPSETTSEAKKETTTIKDAISSEPYTEDISTQTKELEKITSEEPKKEKHSKKASITISKDKPVKDQVKALGLNFSTPKVIMLTHDLNKFFRIRAKQLGLTFTEYFNVLLWDYKEQNKKKNNSTEDIYDICTERYSGKKERNNIFFTDQDLNYIEEETINSGVTLTQFACYLIGLEMQREEIEGKRK